ncbi:MAG: hypothetical protein NTV61_01555 [Candidatus Bathyarchaeota archaeon]|nr:hypothetical protein [Candidatus Bathyarchaeota archaeon]
MLPPKDVLRDRIARIIAATRFPFVDQTTWDEDRKTLVNTRSEKPYPIEGPRGKVYPSVVVLNPDGAVREIGEVEMEFKPSLAAKWRLLSEKTGMGERYKKLFVYVPAGDGEKARRLLEENGIEYAGLREWSIEGGALVTRPVVTPDMDYDHRVS